MLAKLTAVSFIRGALYLKRLHPKVLVLQQVLEKWQSCFPWRSSRSMTVKRGCGAHREPAVTCVEHICVRNAPADVIDRVTKAGRCHMSPSSVVGKGTKRGIQRPTQGNYTAECFHTRKTAVLPQSGLQSATVLCRHITADSILHIIKVYRIV